jgi:hypothetical protein
VRIEHLRTVIFLVRYRHHHPANVSIRRNRWIMMLEELLEGVKGLVTSDLIWMGFCYKSHGMASNTGKESNRCYWERPKESGTKREKWDEMLGGQHP